MFRDALCQKHGIRDCFVRVERLTDDQIPKKKKWLSAPKARSVRLEVSWLPSVSATKSSSCAALKCLADYRKGI